MAWVNKRYECSECFSLHDTWEDAKDCCYYVEDPYVDNDVW